MMNTMLYSGAYVHNEEESNTTFVPSMSYYENGYQPNAPLFTEQEIYGFEPAQQNIGASMMEEEQMCMEMSMEWEQQQMKHEEAVNMSIGYYENDTSFTGNSNIAYNAEFYTGSCQASPFNVPQQPPNSFLDPSHPVSPITPAGSPLNSNAYGFNHAAPSAFLLVPTANNGHYQQFSAYQVPMGPLNVPHENYIGPVALPSTTSCHQSPYTIASSISSPEPPALEDSDNTMSSILPHSGNTELRGMGLYDDTPELMHTELESYSPITPHDQLRPTLGKGLVLEKSFGLPEEMMMKDQTSGKIVKGRIELEDDIEIYQDEDDDDEIDLSFANNTIY